MCFSANASFGMGTVLLVIGIVNVKQIRNFQEFPFASIPILFSIQQFIEGFLWLSFMRGIPEWELPATYGFLVFAQIIWPIWVPLSVYLLEKKPKNKSALLFMIILAFIYSSFMVYEFMIYPVDAFIENHHMFYKSADTSMIFPFNTILYFFVTVGSLFISSLEKMKILGGLILISALFSAYYFKDHFISIWCFFAAGISAFCFVIMRNLNSNKKSR